MRLQRSIFAQDESSIDQNESDYTYINMLLVN